MDEAVQAMPAMCGRLHTCSSLLSGACARLRTNALDVGHCGESFRKHAALNYFGVNTLVCATGSAWQKGIGQEVWDRRHGDIAV